MIGLIEDAGFIITGYILTFATAGVIAWRVVRAGKALGRQIPDDDKYWT